MRRGPLEAKGTQRTYPEARPTKRDMVSRLWQGKDISKTMRVACAKAQVMGAPSWCHMVCLRLGTTLKWAKTPAEDTRLASHRARPSMCPVPRPRTEKPHHGREHFRGVSHGPQYEFNVCSNKIDGGRLGNSDFGANHEASNYSSKCKP